MARKPVKIIGRGSADWHGNGVENGCLTSWSGYATPDELVSKAPNGTPVYDARDASHDAFVTWVFNSKYVDARLTKFEDNGSYCSPLRLIDDLRRRVPGVRFGVVKSGAIIWES